MEQHPRIDLEAYFPCFFPSHRDGARLNACFRIVQGKESYRTYFSYFRPAGRYYSSTLVRVQYKVLVLSLLFALTFPVFACSGTVESAVQKCPIGHWSGRQQRGWWQRLRKAEERKRRQQQNQLLLPLIKSNKENNNRSGGAYVP
jgi:hypothetical protein